jgi:hypothetical protein
MLGPGCENRGTALLPRQVTQNWHVDEPIKDTPEDTALAEDIDLNAIRRVVATALPGRPG